MSRLRVRTPSGAWLDICESEWYVRDAKNLNWIRLVVSKEMKVRHGSNAYWLNIECDVDDIYCPPDEVLECWPGATGDFDNGVIADGGPTGSRICDCDFQNCITYAGPGPSGEGNGINGQNSGGYLLATSASATAFGSKENPLPCPTTAYGGKAAITEFYVDVSQISGMVTLNARGITGDIRVRIYKNCELLADTREASNATRNGIKSYVTKFMNDTTSGIGRVLVRVDAPADNTLWDVALSCPNQDPDFTDIQPAPCYGTYHALIGCTAFAYERIHKLDGSGLTWLDITVGLEPIRVFVYYQGKLLAASGTIEKTTSISFNFAPLRGDDLVTIRIECDQPTTEWTYALYCAGQDGSMRKPDYCCGGGIPARCEDFGKHCAAEFWRNSNGADITDTWYDLSAQVDGKVYIPYTLTGEKPMQILVYQNGNVMTGAGPLVGSGRLSFLFYKAKGTQIRIRVIGTCCPVWRFHLQCPIPFPTVCVDNPRLVRGPEGTISQLCYTLTLDHFYDEPVSVDYETRSSNAVGVYAQTNILVEDEYNYPFLAVADSGTGRVIYDAGFPKFYNVTVNPVTDQYLRNVANYCTKPGKAKRALVMSTAMRGQSYPADETPTGFGTRVPNILREIGFEVDVTCRGDAMFGATFDFDVDRLMPYSFVIFLATENSPTTTERTATAFGQFVKDGNGLFIVTDHDAFHYGANMIAKQYGVTFSGSVDRAPVSIARSIQIYGDSPLWEGIRDQIFPAGASEGIIGVELAPPDYVPKKGTATFPACATTTQVCVEIWGISRPGPDRTIELVLKNGNGVYICNPGVGVGTIENNVVANCPANAQLIVKDGGVSPQVGSGARLMYTQENLGGANYGFSAILDMKINFPAEGIYRFYVWGDDEAELYVDCDIVVKHVLSSGTVIVQEGPASRPYWVPAGEVYLYLIYTNKGPRGRSSSAVAMKIMHPNGSAFYASNAADWRSRILDMGLPPLCPQVASTCNTGGTVAVIASNSYNDHNIGYPAQRIQSAAHAVNCAPGGRYYVMERMITFPVSGIYTWAGTADDNFWLYLDCALVASGNYWEATFRGSFYAEAGEHLMTINYQNVPNCTPGWAKIAILQPDGTPFYYTAPEGWLSKEGNLSDLGFPMTYKGGNGVAQSLAVYGARIIGPQRQPDHSYWTAELKFTFPKSDTYTITAYGDDQVTIYIDCARVVFTDLEWRRTVSATFTAGQGESSIICRGYNYEGGQPAYVVFVIRDSGGAVIYASDTPGWKARLGDLDWSGILVQ